jgi:LDH2 family malate/lactate/ureidoglycolate dehydrogenase
MRRQTDTLIPVPSQYIFSAEALRAFTQAIFEAVRVPEGHARLMASSFVAANLRGVDSHGVQLLPLYIQAIELGNVNLTGEGRVAAESGACLLYDGENAFGQVISDRCCGHAVRLGRQHGAGVVTVRESNHFGAAAYWAQKISAEGLIGIVLSNASPLVAPWQGREPRYGTNPICISVPGPDTFLLDMATTTVALNRIFKAALNNEPSIPAGWAMDKDGLPTTATQAGLEGFPMPLGGYKGTGLAIMIEVLVAVLSGGAMLTELHGLRKQGKPMRVGHLFLSIDVRRFLPMEEFVARMEKMRGILKNTAPAPGYDEVLVAGEPEWRAAAGRARDGIPVPQPTWDKLAELAARLSVGVPEPAKVE